MITECQCDMPVWVYCDWLADQGWEVKGLEEELEFVVEFSWMPAAVYKSIGNEGRYSGQWNEEERSELWEEAHDQLYTMYWPITFYEYRNFTDFVYENNGM